MKEEGRKKENVLKIVCLVAFKGSLAHAHKEIMGLTHA